MQFFKKTISLNQAAKISGYTQDYLGYLIRNGELKGIKKGGIWFTTEKEVKNYILKKKTIYVESAPKGSVKKVKVISLHQAAKISGYTQDYLGYLIRSGEMKGVKKGRNWFTAEDEVRSYISKQNNLHKKSNIKNPVFKNPSNFSSSLFARNISVYAFILLIGVSLFGFYFFGKYNNQVRVFVATSGITTKHFLISTAEFSSSLSDKIANNVVDSFNGSIRISKELGDELFASASSSGVSIKEFGSSIWNGITSGVNSFLALFSNKEATTPQINIPPSLVTNTNLIITPPYIDPLRPTGTSPLTGGGNTTPKVASSVINNITQQQRDVYINQYDPAIIPRIQGIEKALQNNIAFNSTQTDRIYYSLGRSISSASDNITEDGTLNDTTLNSPIIDDASITNFIATGQTIFTKVPTLAHAFDPSWPSDISNVSDSTIYINSAESVADGNLLGLAVGGVVKFLVDAEGDVYGNNLILTGSTTTGATTVNDSLLILGTFSQTGAYTFSTGTGAVSLNGATSITGTNTFTVGTGLTTLGGDLTVTGTAWTATPTISGLITATSGLIATTGNITATAGNVAITAGLLSLNGVTRIDNAGVGTFTSISSGAGAISGGAGSFTTLTSSGSSTLATGIDTTNTFGSGASSINTIGSATAPGALTLHGVTTLDNTFSQTGANTFGTGTGAVSLNGDTTVTGSNSFATGTGTSTFGGNILASTGSINIGSSGTRFGIIYTDNLDATNISGVIVTGSTSSNDWTINSDNGTADTENMSLAFERGTLSPNATLVWDATGKKFILNAPLELSSGIGNASITVPIIYTQNGYLSTPTNTATSIVTIDGTQTLTNKTLPTLTFGTHLTGTSYNGSTEVTIATDATDANTVSTIVARDASGNFSAETITASLTGNVSGTSATVTTAAQPNITSVGTLTGLTMGGTLAMGSNVITSTGTISSGLINGQTISNVANFTGSLTSTGLLTASNGFTMTAGTLSLPANSITDAMISNTLTASDLVAGSSIVSDAEVDDNLTITSGSIDATTTIAKSPVITLGTDLSGSVTLTNLASGTLNATIAADSVALTTDTTGNYVGTITGSTTITSSGATTGEGIAHTLSVTADSIGDTQLAYNTGQNLTTASSPSFAGLTLTGVATWSGGGSANANTAYSHSQTTTNVHGLTFTAEGSGGGLDADTVDTLHASSFMAAGTDNWVNTTGDTMTGALTINLGASATYPLVLTSSSVTTSMGSLNGSYFHNNTTASSGFYYYQNITTAGQFNGSGAGLTGTAGSLTAGSANAVSFNGGLTTTSNPTFGTVSAALSGNATSASNFNNGTSYSSSGNVYATTFNGALSGNATTATNAVHVTDASQPAITSVGTLSGLTVSGGAVIGDMNYGFMNSSFQAGRNFVWSVSPAAMNWGISYYQGGSDYFAFHPNGDPANPSMKIQGNTVTAGTFSGALSGNATSATNFNNGTSYSSGGNVYATTFNGALSGNATTATTATNVDGGYARLATIKGTDQIIENNSGAYLHIGSWGVARTAADAVLVNTAYMADSATIAGSITSQGALATQSAVTDAQVPNDITINNATNADTLDTYHQASFLRVSSSSSNVLNGNFAIGTDGARNFIQSHSSQPLDINPLGNAVTINGNTAWTTGNLTNLNQLTNGPGYITDGNTNWDNSYGYITNNNANYLVTSGNGNGVCFWTDCTNYKVSMSNGADYQYGPVTDYSIKLTMSAGAGRGITFGSAGATPVAAINTTSGNFQTAGTINAIGNISAYGFQGNANIGGTGSASWHPSGIYSAGPSWLYGAIYMNGALTGATAITATNFYGALTGHASLDVAKTGDTMTGVLNIASGDSSYTHYGPNSSWGASLYVGATPWRGGNSVASVIATDGNLHLDSGSNNDMYLNYYASGRPIHVYGAMDSNSTITAPTFSGALTGNVTGSASLNVLKSGDTMSGNLYFNNYGLGIIGTYSSTNYQGVFAMGDSYKLPAGGGTPGTLYGIAWTHSNVGGESKAGLGHQMLVMENGITQTAIGNGIWTRAAITAVGAISASNFSGSSSGTNTGDQTNISGNAATATNFNNGTSYSSGGNVYATTFSGALSGNATSATNASYAAEATNNYFYVRGTSPSIHFVDTDEGATRWVHHNGGNIGFLGSTSSWIFRVNDASEVISGTYNGQTISAAANFTGTLTSAGKVNVGGGGISDRKFEVVTNGSNDGLTIGQDVDNSSTIQTYIDGQWTGRVGYAGGCCNLLKINPDVGDVKLGASFYVTNAGALSGATTGSFSSTVTAPTFSGALSGNATSATNFNNGTSYSSGGNVYATTFNGALSGNATSANTLNVISAHSPINLNTMALGRAYTYSSGGDWINGPSGMNYGSVYNLGGVDASSLSVQIAADVNHNSTLSTKQLWFRTGNNLGFQNDWKEIIHSGNIGSQTVATAGNLTGHATGYALADGGTSTYATYLWSVSHPGSYYISNTWDGTYWQLTSNHGSPVNVGHASVAASADAVSFNGGLTTTSDPTFNSIYLANGNLRLNQGGGTALHVVTAYGNMDLGAQNGSWTHMYASLPFYFNTELYVNGVQVVKNSGTWGISVTGNASTATTFSTNRTNYKGVTDGAVAGQLMWKNYGNNHTIFDASNGASPDGGAVDNTNSAVAWAGSYPTLMGWNGSSTYGVRVDSARLADNASGLTGTPNITVGTITSGLINGQTITGTANFTGTLTTAGGINVNGQATFGTSANTYLYLRDDESTTGAKSIHANSNIAGFLNGAGSWMSYWDNAGNQYNTGTVTAPTFSGALSGNATSATTAGSTGILTGSAHTNGSDGWFRSDGGAGWFNETYGVGVYATQAGRVDLYNGASLYVPAAITAVGAISASNFSGSSSGTNTGDQTNISGNAATATLASTATIYTDRTDGTYYQAMWATSGGTSLYSTANVSIRSSAYGGIAFNGNAWTLEGNATYGLYSNTGLDAAGGLWDAGNRVYSAGNPQVNITGSAGSATTAGTATYATYLWSVSHPGSYYISNTWDGTYWQLTSNHGSPVNVGHATVAASADAVSFNGGLTTGSSPSFAGLTLTGALLGAGRPVDWGNINAGSYAGNSYYAYTSMCVSNNSGTCDSANGVVLGIDNNSAYTNFPSSGDSFIGGNVGIGTTGPVYKLDVVGTNVTSRFSGGTSGVYAEGTSFGIQATATSLSGTGVYGSNMYSSATGYGVYGYSSSGIAVRGNGSTYDFYATGAGVDYGTSSSIRWKNNIQPIDNALEKVLNLSGVYYDWDAAHGGQHDMGMIAEDVGKIVPEIVALDPDAPGYATGMDYGHLTPILVEAIKELSFRSSGLQTLGASVSTTPSITIDTNGNVGIGTTSPNVKLEVNGTIRQNCVTAGALYANASGDIICNPSSINFKNGRTDLMDGLQILVQLQPVSYKFNENINMGEKKHLGFISEEVANVLPEFATYDKEGKAYGLDTTAILAVTVNAVKELNLKLESVNDINTPNTLRDNLTAWLANAENKITRIFTGEVCLTDPGQEAVCINRSELQSLKALIIDSNSDGNNGGGGADTTAPEITLTGDALINIAKDVAYTDLGASAEDNKDGDITTTVVVGGDAVNIAVSGIYTITYNVSDTAGNNATEVTRKVNVGEYVIPEVTLESISIITPATKTLYAVNELLDITGLEITGTYSDGSIKIETITADNVTGFDSSIPIAEQTLTITTGGKTATYNIEVK